MVVRRLLTSPRRSGLSVASIVHQKADAEPRMGKIRIGVMGAGLIGRRHIATIRASTECEIVGLVEPNRAILPADARDLALYPDHLALLREAKPDAVVIATPNQTHASIG